MNDLSSRALLDLQEARRYVLRNETDGSRDDLLIDAVNLVSDAIWVHCEREFLMSGTDVVRTFVLRRRVLDSAPVGWINLVPYDLRVADEVKLYTDQSASNQKILTADEYRLRPVGGSLGGTFFEIMTIEPTNSEEQPGFGWEATVTGDWGMSTAPETVKLACAQWVKNILENPGSYASAAMAGYTVTPELDFSIAGRAGMPSAVRHRLVPYKRGF